MIVWNDDQVICALATPPGKSALAIIRLSGTNVLQKCRTLLPFLPNQIESHRVYFGVAKDNNNQPLDEVVATYFAQGRSFTGEQSIEITSHGGEMVVESILRELVNLGCKIAKPGEFSYRAFMNGRIDLPQAESILSLIHAQSDRSRNLAVRQLRGELSALVNEVQGEVTWLLAHLEASIDFSTEGIEVADNRELERRCQTVLTKIESLVASYQQGRLIRDGLKVAIVGRPNAGKSSLLNFLVGEDKAIVTEHAGTTRDLIDAAIYWKGQKIVFVDSAGLRQTADDVEKIGIERTQTMMKEADLVLYVIDGSEANIESDIINIKSLTNKNIALIVNKKDLISEKKINYIKSAFFDFTQNVVSISCKQSLGKKEILDLITQLDISSSTVDSEILIHHRQFELACRMQEYLVRALQELQNNSSPEFASLPLQNVHQCCQELLGARTEDAVVDKIFKEFCLGK